MAVAGLRLGDRSALRGGFGTSLRAMEDMWAYPTRPVGRAFLRIMKVLSGHDQCPTKPFEDEIPFCLFSNQ